MESYIDTQFPRFESVNKASSRQMADIPTLRDMPLVRRVLHLLWEILWPFEIVWNASSNAATSGTEALSWTSHGER